jgi:DNA-binding MarR family transcriptional regulator
MTEQRPIGFWLKLVDRQIEDLFATTLEEHGVTRRQWQLLNVLALGQSTTEKLDAAIAPFLGQSGASESSVEHLTELIDSGWVSATHDGYDLTERGRAAFDGLAAVVFENRRRITDGITEQEYGETLGILERIARNLGWSDS